MRVAFFLRVSRLDFRIGVSELVTLLLFSAALDVGVDFVRYGPEASFWWWGVSGETYAAGAVLLVAALLSMVLRQQALALALPLVVFAASTPIQLLPLVPALTGGWLPAALLSAGWQNAALLLWAIAIFSRAAALVLVPSTGVRRLRPLACALALLGPLWFGSVFAPDVAWWSPAGDLAGADSRYPNPASEPVMEAQRVLLDEALGALEDARTGVTDLYAIGFAANGDDAAREEVSRALQVLDERWATDGRSIALVNHPAGLLETPLASVSNLRATLEELKATIDADEDVVLLYVAGKAAPGGAVEVSLPPLDLVPLSPVGVRRLLDESGIRWRIVVVSACFGGAWREALADDTTLVMTATGGDEAGDGCALEEHGSVFGDALFNHGMVEADTFTGAFDIARKIVAERAGQVGEQRAPQIHVGSAMAAKLREIEQGRAARRASRSV